MNTLVVGGYGQIGVPVVRHLARSELIDEVAIAGRDRARAEQAAAEVGPKASALRLDATDPVAVRKAVGGRGLVLNLLPEPERFQDPIIRAAIDVGAHFCGVHQREPDAALHAAATKAGVTVLHGAGFHPGFLDLVGRLAYEGVDDLECVVEGLLYAPLQGIWTDLYRRYFPLPNGLDRGPQAEALPALLTGGGDEDALLAAIRDARVLEMWLHWMCSTEPATATIPAHREGRRIEVTPPIDGVDVPFAAGRGEPGMTVAPAVMAVAAGHVPGRPDVPLTRVRMSGFSAAFDRLVRDGSDAIRNGDADFDATVRRAQAAVAADLPSFLLPAPVFAGLPGAFHVAYGRRDGRPARAAAWSTHAWWTPRNWVDMTSANVALTALRLLRGEINAVGLARVAEADRIDDAYLQELAALLPETPEGDMVGTLLEYPDAKP